MEVTLLADEKGEKLISLDGYLYVQNSVSAQAIVWRCKDRMTKACPARLRTSVQLTNPISVNSHTHSPPTVPSSEIVQLTENYANSLKCDVIQEGGSQLTKIESPLNETETSGPISNIEERNYPPCSVVMLDNDYVTSMRNDGLSMNQTKSQLGSEFHNVADNETYFDMLEQNNCARDENNEEDEPMADADDPPYVYSGPDSEPEKTQSKRVEHNTGQFTNGINENEPKVQLSYLSGLFGCGRIIKRKKKPNAMKGPTSKEMPPEPRYARDICIEGLWANTDSKNPQRFLLYDNHDNNIDNRVILFITDDHLTLLCKTNEVHTESSLPVPPHIFAQLYLIQASLHDNRYIVTVGYAFMGSRKEESYVEVFQAIKSKAKDLGLVMESFENGTIFMNFEKPAINAVKRVFGQGVKVESKFFHLNRNVWKKICDLDLVSLCQISEDFKLFCTSLVCLAFLPLEDVRQGMLHLKQAAPLNNMKVDLLLDWFDSTFVSGAVKATRIISSSHQDHKSAANGAKTSETIELHQTTCPFPPEKWNFHHTILSSNTRYENILEGSSWTVKHLIGHSRTSLYRTIKYVRMEEAYMTEKITQHDCSADGGTLYQRRPKKNCVSSQDRLNRLVVSYRENDLSLSSFLLAAAKTIRLGEM